jgi:hypothetical protein
MAEIINCPKCGRKLQVPVSYYGQTVQCPECAFSFMADPQAQAVQATPPASQPTAANPVADSRPRPRDDDDDDWEDVSFPRFSTRRLEVPNRGGVILAIGIMSLVMFFPFSLFLGPIAWVMGNSDLAQIRAGRMDPNGEGMVQAGRVLGMIATIMMLVSVFSICGLLALMMASRR